MDKAFENRRRKLEAIAFRICKNRQLLTDAVCIFQADNDFATMVQSVCLPENQMQNLEVSQKDSSFSQSLDII